VRSLLSLRIFSPSRSFLITCSGVAVSFHVVRPLCPPWNTLELVAMSGFTKDSVPRVRALITSTLVLALVACGGRSAFTDSSPPSKPNQSEELVLRGDGLGIVSFGHSRTDVVAALTERFGPAADERADSGECPLDPLDQILYFYGIAAGSRDGVFSAAGFRDGVFSYYATSNDTYATAEGIGPGSTVDEIEAAYGRGLNIDNEAETMGPLYRMQTETGEVRGQFGDVILPDETPGLIHLSAGPGCI